MTFDCKKCIHVDWEDDDYCADCSNLWKDVCCSCHLNPPCSFCTNNLYEEKRGELIL